MQYKWLENQLKQHPWLTETIAILAGGAYFIQSWFYSITRDSVLDEGLYLLKGYLFVSGEYQPFQANGVLTNHMPLSFLIPGFFQDTFGPGLRTGRLYAVFISLVFMVGTWILVRRLGGRWWAAIVISALAMNPMMIRVYSLAVSQGLVACLLVWILVLSIGKNRSHWQILLGSFLAGILLMTRLNMAPVLVFLFAYLFWQHSPKRGGWALVAALFPVLWGHIHYFPEIMVLWAKWLPAEITPFFSQWRFDGLSLIPSADFSSTVRLKGLFQGFVLHYVPWVGILASWIFWPKKWRRDIRSSAVLFSSLYVFLLLLHAWATLGGSHCVFCFSWYQYFFEILAILVVVATWRYWNLDLKQWRKALAWGLNLVVVFSVIFGQAFQLSEGFSDEFSETVRNLMRVPVPRLANWRIQPGQIEFWGLVANKLGLMSRYPYEVAYQMVENSLRAFLALVIGSLILLAFWWVSGWIQKGIQRVDDDVARIDRNALVLILVLIAGWLITPLGWMGSNQDSHDCGYNVIDTYELAGLQLADQIPPGSTVFWRGGDTQAALLYLVGDVEFFPALFNASFANREGDPIELERYGLWNDELIQQWAREADVILIEERNYGGWLADYVTLGDFNELKPTAAMGCREGTSIHVYLRLP